MRGAGLRLALMGLALAGMAYGVAFVSDTSDAGSGMARRIVAGRTFLPAELEVALADAPLDGPDCQAEKRQAHLVIRAERVDQLLSGEDLARLDQDTAALLHESESLLACSPRDAFAWLMRYWSQTRLIGFGDKALQSLERSYRFGPREAWIAVRRNRMALGVFRRLPSPLQATVKAEFAALLDLQIIEPSIETLSRTPPAVRAELYDVMAQRPESTRVKIGLALRERGLSTEGLALPAQPARPWRGG